MGFWRRVASTYAETSTLVYEQLLPITSITIMNFNMLNDAVVGLDNHDVMIMNKAKLDVRIKCHCID